MGGDPEDVLSFMLSDEMGRRLVEGKDPEAVQAGTVAALDALAPYAAPEGVVLDGAYWLVPRVRRSGRSTSRVRVSVREQRAAVSASDGALPYYRPPWRR